jgi:hypothetical protein
MRFVRTAVVVLAAMGLPGVAPGNAILVFEIQRLEVGE